MRSQICSRFFSFLQTVFMREIANFAEPLHLLLVRWKEYIESTKWKSLGEEKDYVVKKLDPRFFQIQILFIIIMINYIGIYSAQFKPEKNRTQKKKLWKPALSAPGCRFSWNDRSERWNCGHVNDLLWEIDVFE